MRARSWWVVFVVAVCAFLFDFFTKRYVETHLFIGEIRPVVPGIFDIVYIRNAGAAFSILQGRTLFLIVVTVLVLAFVVLYGQVLIRLGPWTRWGTGLVLGGAVGNLLDRVRFGGVSDFLHIHHWPVFNFADSSVVVGGIIVAVTLLRDRPEPDSLQEFEGESAVGGPGTVGRDAAVSGSADSKSESTGDPGGVR